MNAEIISVSSELLRGQAVNESVAFLTKELTPLGIHVEQSIMIDDSEKALKNAVKGAEARTDFIIITGGLGPDTDDITKIAISDYFDVPLVLDQDTQDRIISYHQNSDLTMPENNQLQALILLGSTPLYNVTGLAVGFFYQKGDTTYILLPGPFDELKPMFLENTKPLIVEKWLDNPIIETKKIRLYGLTFAEVNHQLKDLLTNNKNPYVGIYFDDEEIEIELTARATSTDKAKNMLKEVEDEIFSRVGEYIFSQEGERLVNVLKNLLRDKDKTITAAESLTGGAFLSALSGEIDAGTILEGGVVTYSENIKNSILNVTKETIENFGVVSAECAVEMAENALEMFDADISVALTGVAGPSSLEGKIPGTVWIGIAEKGKETFAKKHHFGYKRNRNRRNSVLTAMNLARLVLLDKPINDVVWLSEQNN